MRTEEFKDTFKRLRYPLDKLFHKKLRDASKLDNFELTKKALIHETGVKAWIRLQREDSNAYKLETLIFLAAEDVWVIFIKPRIKERHVFYEPEKMEAFFDNYEMQAQLEAIDYLSKLPAQHDGLIWEMLTMRAEGHTYQEISELMHISRTCVMDKVIKTQTKLKGNMLSKPPDTPKENP